MMITYSGHSKLRSKRGFQIVYEDVILASDSLTLEHLKELSSKRKAVEEFVNESSFVTEAIAREISGGLTSHVEQGIQKLEQYIPLLENLVHYVNENQNHPRIGKWISELQIRWSSVLAPTLIFPFQGPKFYQINDIYFELGMTLFLYATLLHDHAVEVLTSDMVKSGSLFRQSAGVFNYLAEDIITKLSRNTQGTQPEVSCSICSAMSLLCLAAAQAVTAKKAEEIGKSRGVLVKLHHGVSEFLNQAMQIAYPQFETVASHLLDFLQTSKALHLSLSHKFYAQGLRSDGKISLAIINLRCAIDDLKKTSSREEKWRSELKKMIHELEMLLEKYENENDFVWHKKVPDKSSAVPLPQAAKIVTPIAYQPHKWERTLVLKW